MFFFISMKRNNKTCGKSRLTKSCYTMTVFNEECAYHKNIMKDLSP